MKKSAIKLQEVPGFLDTLRFAWQKPEVEESRRRIVRDSYSVDGALFWNANNAAIPLDVFKDAGLKAPEGQQKARDQYVSKSLSDYRKANEGHEYTSEEKLEMNATFGPGVEVVNVITGKKHRT